MGFNLMAALGGAGRAMSQSIQEDRLQMDKIELMDAEAATRERLAKAAEKREEDKANEKIASRLKGMGFDSSRIAYIMAQGSGFAESMIDHATQAYKNGRDPNTILKYSENIDEFKTVSGVKPNESMLPEGFVLDPEIPEISKYFDLDSGVTSTLYVEPSEKQTLEEMRRDIQIKLIEGNWTAEDIADPSSEWGQLTKKSLAYTKSIKDLAEAKKGVVPEDDSNNTDIYSKSDARNELKLFVQQVAISQGFESIEGAIQNIEAGTQGKAGVARLSANISFKESIKESGGSRNATAIQTSDYNDTIVQLKNTAISTAYAAQNLGEEGNEGLATRYKKKNENDETYTINELKAFSGGRPPNVNIGDVILLEGKIAIYTGFSHEYGGYPMPEVAEGKMILPYVFANVDKDPAFNITKTER
jgi:hypothetical protein